MSLNRNNSNTVPIDHCEVCGNTNLRTVLDLGNHPMCDDLIEIDSMRVCNEYPIEIVYCNNCFTAHQKYQVPKHELFPKTYHYRSRFTADVLNGMESLVLSCEQLFGSLDGKNVLDIGCNDGSLLSFFKIRGLNTFGIEPTDSYKDAIEAGHIVYNDFLSEEAVEKFLTHHKKPDFITFTNVFAHIENLEEVIRALKRLMSEKTVLIIENHYLGSVLLKNQFDTFYHEHPRTYSYKSFEFIAKSLERELMGAVFPARYGGNIRIFMGNETIHHKLIGDNSNLIAKEKEFEGEFDKMQENILKWVNVKRTQIFKIIEESGKLQAKAFPGRAAILIKMLNLSEDEIECVYEKPGSMKIGHFLPGTRIQIVSDDELFKKNNLDFPLLNLAWHISDEIKAYLKKKGFKGEIIDILSSADFN